MLNFWSLLVSLACLGYVVYEFHTTVSLLQEERSSLHRVVAELKEAREQARTAEESLKRLEGAYKAAQLRSREEGQSCRAEVEGLKRELKESFAQEEITMKEADEAEAELEQCLLAKDGKAPATGRRNRTAR